MYIPDQFLEEQPEMLQAFVAQHPLGALVAMTTEGITANHIPMLWMARGSTPGVLQGHVARANSIWQAVAADAGALVIFSGGNHYITPTWYPARLEHGKVVPTWNYSVVHAHGTIRFFPDDPKIARQRVEELTDHHEARRAAPWKIADAPSEYIESLLSKIVPFEITIERFVGKFKCSQHRDERERGCVLDGLAADGVPALDRSEVIRAPYRSGNT